MPGDSESPNRSCLAKFELSGISKHPIELLKNRCTLIGLLTVTLYTLETRKFRAAKDIWNDEI